MNDSSGTHGVRLLVVGFGAAGRVYCEAFAKAGAKVTAVDPALNATAMEAGGRLGIDTSHTLPDTLDGMDLAVVLTPASVSLKIEAAIGERPGACPVLDLTSSTPEAMHAAQELLGDRLVDGTVMGAVGLGGVATPMILAGKKAQAVADILAPLGCRITCLDGAPGEASTLKLLRSLFMKGLEALVVETQLAAAALDQSENLPLALSDLSEVDINAFLAEMLRTHPKHAARRHVEIVAASDLMEKAGMRPIMADAASSLFARTASFGAGPDETPGHAIDWLLKTTQPDCEERHEQSPGHLDH